MVWKHSSNSDRYAIQNVKCCTRDHIFSDLQACLGAKAKAGDRNVVQLTTESIEGESITHTILSMRLGANEQVKLCNDGKKHLAVFFLLLLEQN